MRMAGQKRPMGSIYKPLVKSLGSQVAAPTSMNRAHRRFEDLELFLHTISYVQPRAIEFHIFFHKPAGNSHMVEKV